MSHLDISGSKNIPGGDASNNNGNAEETGLRTTMSCPFLLGYFLETNDATGVRHYCSLSLNS